MESKLLDTITEIVGEGIVCVNAASSWRVGAPIPPAPFSLETLCSSRTTCWGTTTAA